MGEKTEEGEQAPDSADLGALLESFRPRLRRMVSLRLDPRLRRRVDSSDVLQEAFVDVARRFDEHRASPDLPFFLWVRFLTAQKLVELHRRHAGAEMRDVRREVAGLDTPEATSASLARAFVDDGDTPAQILMREEHEQKLQEALEKLKPNDREILMLRHFERLAYDECARVLGIQLSAAKVRHLRAAKRLREVLREYPELPDGLLLS